MSAPAIRLRDVSKFYKLYDSPQDRLKEALHPLGRSYHRDFYALRDINLQVRKGEILGVVGRNGCGKSTLLKLISGVLTPSKGSVEVSGEIAALLELGAGFNPEFSGRQNIYFYATILGLSRAQIEAVMGDIVAFADIGSFIDQPLKTYSSGMKARLGFAVAVHIEPDILILDEVLAVGDALFKRKCYARMEELFSRDKTILFVSHNTNSIIELCSRAILIEGGAILYEGDPRQVAGFYQKLIFAKPKNRQAILEEIAAEQQLDAEAAATATVQADAGRRDRAFFIPDFVSGGRREDGGGEAVISDCRILDERDNVVNALVHGDRYRYVFRVQYAVEAAEVSVGSRFLTEKGLLVSGISLANNRRHLAVRPGDLIEVTIPFTCRLREGNYYITTATSKKVMNSWEFMSKITDAVAFKVLPAAGDPYTGIVSLDQQIEVERP